MSIDPTAEQVTARAKFATGANLAIEAGAGTGKTSTLVMLAESCPDRMGQYIAFNKAIVTDAGAKLPGNVNASTAHSLAFRAVGQPFAPRLRSPRMKSNEIARMLRIDPLTISYGSQHKSLAKGYLAGLAMRAIGIFCQSVDAEPGEQHVPYVDGIDVPNADGHRTYLNNRLVRAHLAPVLRRAWSDLSRPDGQLPFKHDHYLKIWQLSKPRILADFILFDEAQDANPVLLDIVTQQTHAQLVFVGDSQQQIYTFTGAVNAMANVVSTGEWEVTFLTQSFRFGQAIADVANGILGRLEAELNLRGFDQIASVVAPVAEPDCVLTRTNAAAVMTVLEAQADGRLAALVGGAAEVVAFARAAADLKDGRFVSHPELACFESWGEVVDYVANDEQGGELRLLVKLIDEFGVETIIRALDRTVPEAGADLIVSTAHKSKGREWDSVQLASDFATPKDGGELSPEELRLLYVACTRAKRELDVTRAPHALAAPAPEPEVLALALDGPGDEVVSRAAALELTRQFGGR